MALPILLLDTQNWAESIAQCPGHWQTWVQQNTQRLEPGRWLAVPSPTGTVEAILIGYDRHQPLWTLAEAVGQLQPGVYRLLPPDGTADGRAVDWEALCLGWGLGAYRYTRFKAAEQALPQLLWPEGVDATRVTVMLQAHQQVRDLINTPAAQLLPADLAAACQAMAEPLGAEVSLIADPAVLQQDHPCLWAVGAASAAAPCLIEWHWGDTTHPHIVLAGKGVCFDSGGLNLKTGNSMRLMKKDMGGAAIVFGLAYLIMALRLPVRLSVLIGAVENAVGSRALRPGDVLQARNGVSIEVDNTDAEGRLVLADLLVRAGELQPDLVIDMATLTGAARVAVGTEISACFATDAALVTQLMPHAERWDDPVWPLPLHQGYTHLLNSEIADCVNSASGGYAGAITAALFLQRFVPKAVPWLHFDIMAWNTRARPGRPKGGEAMALRALWSWLESRYGK